MKSKAQGKPNVVVFHIESGTCLEEIAVCKFLKHCVVVLGIVTSDVANLIKSIFSNVSWKVSTPTLGTIWRRLHTLYSA